MIRLSHGESSHYNETGPQIDQMKGKTYLKVCLCVLRMENWQIPLQKLDCEGDLKNLLVEELAY